ncbi:hypothetical protein SAMN02745824_3397 [Parasphingorhabdus marina DSM 22363]|uniref:Phage terminase small subunit n=1 Tax=Parasphingorhabdus marina DSM 22363 TaxID=1123272 RepID=A0A1N6HPM5_9SPHN|nr:hypothetical protein [Parasphingorhabdus marina]SIO21764.1 hypothetical protein SAMN02745824_3397 [Parasphingorhabdus marina DSM 22363]
MTAKKPKNPLIPSYNPGNRKIRHDGWTPARTKTFLATLRQTGCVTDAARTIGMSTASGYRLRKRDAVFRAAWDEALADARRGLIAVAHERAVVGRETVIIRKGEEVERRIQPSDAMLALLIKHGDMGGDGAGRQRIGNRTADKILTQDEWRAGMGFDGRGEKVDAVTLYGDTRARIDAKLDRMRARLEQEQERTGERRINIRTGEGITPEVIAAVQRFAAGVDCGG